ncbi:MAG TPA: flagellar export chaperone FliS [Candidatus Saccharimonadales bacterium]|nr:flagellar export chaperone FliS [Candidatus Saccharimonadales bacterium]
MLQRNNPWQSYRKVAIQTASPGHLVLMLYDGAIRFLERGLTGFDYQDPAQFNQTISNNIIRAQAIIREMNARLDMEQGGEISENFRRLYNYFNRRLQQANLKKQKEPIEEVLGHLREIRDSWAEMLSQGRANDEATSATAELQPAR